MNIQQKKRAKSNKLSDDKYVISLNYFNKRNIIVSGKCSVYFKGVDNMDYRFKIIAKLKDDLNYNDRENALEKIKSLQELYSMKKMDSYTFVNSSTSNKEIASSAFFFINLRYIKDKFEILRYYDKVDDEVEIAV